MSNFMKKCTYKLRHVGYIVLTPLCCFRVRHSSKHNNRYGTRPDGKSGGRTINLEAFSKIFKGSAMVSVIASLSASALAMGSAMVLAKALF